MITESMQSMHAESLDYIIVHGLKNITTTNCFPRVAVIASHALNILSLTVQVDVIVPPFYFCD